jgi:hypothetical protein
MKKLALALLLLQPFAVFAATKSANPADYPVIVHIVYSRYDVYESPAFQRLDVVIDGQQMELRCEGGGTGVLALADYHAQLRKGKATGAPSKLNGFDSHDCYRFLLPDGTIRDFDVVGLGPKDDSANPSHRHESLAFAIPSNQQMLSPSAIPVSLALPTAPPRVTTRHDFA